MTDGCPYYPAEIHSALLDFPYCTYILPLGQLGEPQLYFPSSNDQFTPIFLEMIEPACKRNISLGVSFFDLTNAPYPGGLPKDVIYACCPKTGEGLCTETKSTFDLMNRMVTDYVGSVERGNRSRKCYNRDHDLVDTYPAAETCVLAMSLRSYVNGPMAFNGLTRESPKSQPPLWAQEQLERRGCASWIVGEPAPRSSYIPDGHCLKRFDATSYDVLCCCYDNTTDCKFFGDQKPPEKDPSWIAQLPSRSDNEARAKIIIDWNVKSHCAHGELKTGQIASTVNGTRSAIVPEVADVCLLKLSLRRSKQEGRIEFTAVMGVADFQADCRDGYANHIPDGVQQTFKIRYMEPRCRNEITTTKVFTVNMCCTGHFCNHPSMDASAVLFEQPMLGIGICGKDTEFEKTFAQYAIDADALVCYRAWDIRKNRTTMEYYQYQLKIDKSLYLDEFTQPNASCAFIVKPTDSGCYRSNETEVLLPRVLFSCEFLPDQLDEMTQGDTLYHMYLKARNMVGCSTTGGTFRPYLEYAQECNEQSCFEPLLGSPACYAVITRDRNGVIMIKAGPVETDVEATNEYARVDAKNELMIIFRKFFPNSASNSVKLICADYYPSCNYMHSKMLYVYHAHAYPNGAEVLGSLTQSCHASENSTEATVATRTSSEDCLVEDSCFIDIKLQEARTIQQGQCYRQTPWEPPPTSPTTTSICEVSKKLYEDVKDPCAAVLLAGQWHMLCCCQHQCLTDTLAQTQTYGFRLPK